MTKASMVEIKAAAMFRRELSIRSAALKNVFHLQSCEADQVACAGTIGPSEESGRKVRRSYMGVNPSNPKSPLQWIASVAIAFPRNSASLHAKDAAASVFAAQNKLYFEFAAICLSPISLTSKGSDVRSGPVPISLLSLDLAPCAGCIGACSMKTKTTNNILNSTVLCLASRR